jgi:short-subunit dehydrogenase
MKISGSKIVITGASRGIGLAVARALAREGGHVALLARSREVEQIAAEIVAGGGDARAYLVDLADPGAVELIGQRIKNELGVPDMVINNAGAGRWLLVEETPPDEAAAMMASPYLAAFYVTRLFLPAMIERRAGYIININSPAAWLSWPGATGYTAARWAMRGFTAALRADLRGTGVRVLQVVPGKVSSTYFEHNPHSEERIPAITRLVPTLTPDDVATAVVRGIKNDRRQMVIPAMMRATLVAHALAPALVDWLMCRTGWRRPSSKPTIRG